jgi:regulator of cell morphogenesis and NO signaling
MSPISLPCPLFSLLAIVMENFPSIGALVKENAQLAEMLHQMGIRFYQEADKTLEQACREKGIDPAKVYQHFELLRKNQDFDLSQLSNYPIEILISLLRHSHQLFIKQKLPFLFHTIEEMDENRFFRPELARDLKMVFPIFAEDFIRHIYEEEDTLFGFIQFLLDCTKSIKNPGELYYILKTRGIQSFAMHHEAHDNEISGIRSLTDDYQLPVDADLFTFILYRELQDFEKQLRQHALIENSLLFPKALRLENEVRWRLDQIRFQN